MVVRMTVFFIPPPFPVACSGSWWPLLRDPTVQRFPSAFDHATVKGGSVRWLRSTER